MSTLKQSGKGGADQLHSLAIVPPSPKIVKIVKRNAQRRMVALGLLKREVNQLTEG